MAKLYFEDGPMVTDLSIQQELSSLSITVARWSIDGTTKSILEKKSLSDEENGPEQFGCLFSTTPRKCGISIT